MKKITNLFKRIFVIQFLHLFEKKLLKMKKFKLDWKTLMLPQERNKLKIILALKKILSLKDQLWHSNPLFFKNNRYCQFVNCLNHVHKLIKKLIWVFNLSLINFIYRFWQRIERFRIHIPFTFIHISIEYINQSK